MADRYLKGVLTVIALELLAIVAGQVAAPVAAQPALAPAPVIIAGIELQQSGSALPVEVRGAVTATLSGPVQVEAVRPLPVIATPYTPGKRPGE